MTNEMFEKTMKFMVRLIIVLTALLAVLTIVCVAVHVEAKDVVANNDKATYVAKQSISNEQSMEPIKPSAPAETTTTTIPEETKTTWYTQEELDLLARLIYFEARGECYEGQVAVGAVVMNRLNASGFPNTIEGVIYQKNQFSPVGSSKWDDEITDYGRCYEAAIEALNGADPTGGALFFYNPKISTSQWIFTRPVVKVIGNHTFAK